MSEPSTPGENFAVASTRLGDAVVVEISGDIDYVTAPWLATELERAVRDQPTPATVIADMSGVRFMASAGLMALAGAVHKAGSQTAVRVVASVGVRRSLEFAGFERLLSIHATRDEALAAR